MPLSNDDKGLLDGIILCAQQGKLSLIQVISKQTGQPVLLLCCDFGMNGNKHLVPVSEMIVGNELETTYTFPDEFRELVNEDDLLVGVPGIDKP